MATSGFILSPLEVISSPTFSTSRVLNSFLCCYCFSLEKNKQKYSSQDLTHLAVTVSAVPAFTCFSFKKRKRKKAYLTFSWEFFKSSKQLWRMPRYWRYWEHSAHLLNQAARSQSSCALRTQEHKLLLIQKPLKKDEFCQESKDHEFCSYTDCCLTSKTS